MLPRILGPMFVAELGFRKLRPLGVRPDQVDAIEGLLGFLTKNGQILGQEYPTVETPTGFSSYVILPEKGALQRRFNYRYVNEALQDLEKQGLARPRVRTLGEKFPSPPPDRCARPGWRVLFTTYLSIASPIRCGDCFAPVPLYRLPERKPFLREHVLFWARAWRACDQLQMGCRVGERFATGRISDPDSDLGSWGRELCVEIGRLTRIPTYLYLYRDGAKSRAREEKRRCPRCGGLWRIDDPVCGLFDFKCDRCRLVSNIAWDVR